MTFLLAIEGLDGSGKATLTRSIEQQLRDRDISYKTIAFPRYGTRYADLASDALHGRAGDLASSAYAMAFIFAEDRRAAKEQLNADVEVIIADRYVYSNAAYSAARMGNVDHEIIDWIEKMEFEDNELPRPNLTAFVDLPSEVAEERSQARSANAGAMAQDAYEKDSELQRAVRSAYHRLSFGSRGSEWMTVEGREQPEHNASLIVNKIVEELG